MLKLVAFLKRRPGMSLEDFRKYYENRHAPLILSLMPRPPRHYVRRYIKFEGNPIDPSAERPQELEFVDCITEVWFDDRAAFDATLGKFSEAVTRQQIADDEDNFLDRTKIRHVVVDEVVSAI
jgi:uncharacterized protein (TIGR02118 family)